MVQVFRRMAEKGRRNVLRVGGGAGAHGVTVRRNLLSCPQLVERRRGCGCGQFSFERVVYVCSDIWAEVGVWRRLECGGEGCSKVCERDAESGRQLASGGANEWQRPISASAEEGEEKTTGWVSDHARNSGVGGGCFGCTNSTQPGGSSELVARDESRWRGPPMKMAAAAAAQQSASSSAQCSRGRTYSRV